MLDSIGDLAKSGQTADQLFGLYMQYGDDPYIIAENEKDPVEFSARSYAKEYCRAYFLKRRRNRIILASVVLILIIAVLAMI